MLAWAWPWLWTADTWAGLQFGVLVIGLVVAYRQAHLAVQLREDATRPFVSIDLSVREKCIYLTVENFGPALARDVRFKFDPPLRSALFQEQIDAFKPFSVRIPTLPPGKTIETILDVFPQRESTGGFEDEYRVDITYAGQRGKKYDDEVRLDLGIYRDRVSVDRNGIHEIHDVLKKMTQDVGKVASLLQAYLRSEHDARKQSLNRGS